MTGSGEPRDVTVALETSISGGSVALFRAGAVIASWEGSEGISRSEDMPEVLGTLLNRNQMDKRRIELIATAVGLGSFTGTRIGLATSLGLKKAIGCRLVRVPLLRALANDVESDGKILAAVSINKREVGWQICSGAVIEGPVQISAFSEFLDTLARFKESHGTSVFSRNLFESVSSAAPKLIGHDIRCRGSNLARFVGNFAILGGVSESNLGLYSSGVRQNRL